jgi:hypothetical protein
MLESDSNSRIRILNSARLQHTRGGSAHVRKEITMSVLVPSDRSIRVATGVAAVLFALSVSAQSRPLGPQVPDTDQRGQIVNPRPPVKSSYDPKTSVVRDHRKPK